MFNLNGKIALITGGGSGLGLAMAECLDKAGAKVIIVGHSDQIKLDQAVSKLSRGVSYLFDITKTQEINEFIDKIIQEQGPIDILINNAGIHCKKSIEDISLDTFQDVLNVHLFATLALCQAVIPSMKARKSGRILMISSMSAFVGLTNVGAYAAAKSAILGLMRTMAAELSSYGITVNAIAPGFIDTPMFRKATDDDPERKEKILNHTPIGCFGEPQDIGWGAVYLASDEARFVNATVLMIDGGFSTGF